MKGAAQRTGELTISLNGMDVKMDQFPPKLSNVIRNGKTCLSVDMYAMTVGWSTELSRGPMFMSTCCDFEAYAISFTPLCLCLLEEALNPFHSDSWSAGHIP